MLSCPCHAIARFYLGKFVAGCCNVGLLAGLKCLHMSLNGREGLPLRWMVSMIAGISCVLTHENFGMKGRSNQRNFNGGKTDLLCIYVLDTLT